MKRFKMFACLMLALALVFTLAACTEEPVTEEPKAEPEVEVTEEPALETTTHTVTFFDSDGLTVLAEVEVQDGQAVEVPELAKEGKMLENYYATPALLIVFDITQPITEDTAIFTAWKSSAVDERAWMLAGSLTGYSENNWGHAWPQDDFLLQPVDGEFNTFFIELNLYQGDEFKIAVIDQDYNWIYQLNSKNLVACDWLVGGEDAFDTGANIKVLEDGMYRITLVSDAETDSLCKISCERIGEAAAPEYSFDLVLHGEFLGWDMANAIPLTRNGDSYVWYCEFDIPEDSLAEGKTTSEFGIKNNGSDGWFSNADGSNLSAEPGHYMLFIELTADNKLVSINFGAPAYYVVGTCGNGAWGADAVDTNTAYMMTANEDGTYSLTVTFTETEIADWADNKVAFKVVYGCCGQVANEFWFGTADGGNVIVDPGTYTITFNPADGSVTATPAA